MKALKKAVMLHCTETPEVVLALPCKLGKMASLTICEVKPERLNVAALLDITERIDTNVRQIYYVSCLL